MMDGPSERRVLHVIADGSPGGGTTHVLQILKGLRGSFRFGLLTMPRSYLLDHARLAGAYTAGLDLFSPGGVIGGMGALRRSIRIFRPDLIHVHGGRAGYFLAVARPHRPVLYTVHGYHLLHRPKLMRSVQKRMERCASRIAVHVIHVCEYDAQAAAAHDLVPGDTPRSVIYNGIPIKASPLPGPKRRFDVGFIGRFEYPKDPLLFLSIMETLPMYQAAMVGSGRLEREVRGRIMRRGLGNVRLLGALPHEDVLELLPSFRVIVMTSRWEGLPILPLEAMRAGVPVVAPDVGGLHEVIEHMRSGLLVRRRDAEAFASAIRQVLDDDALRGGLIAGGRERVRERFSEDRMLSELKARYLSLL